MEQVSCFLRMCLDMHNETVILNGCYGLKYFLNERE